MSLLFHATTRTALASIAAHGLRELSYWSSDDDVCAYYAETIEEDGDVPVVLVVDLDDPILRSGQDSFEPDYPGIDEPITGALGKTEKEIWAAWSACGKEWRDSLEIIHSLRIRVPVPANILRVMDSHSGETYGLEEYLGMKPVERPNFY
jgi:hypothetical protein